jgi:hypothetical protein
MLASWNLLTNKVMAMFDHEANSQLLATFKDVLCLVVLSMQSQTQHCDDDDTASFAECDGPIPMLA